MGKKKGINAEKVMLILLALMVLVGAIVISVLFTMRERNKPSLVAANRTIILNGNYLDTDHEIYSSPKRKAYWLPAEDTMRELAVTFRQSTNLSTVRFCLDENSYELSPMSNKLYGCGKGNKKTLISDSGRFPVLSVNGTLYISTSFMQKHLDCSVDDLTDYDMSIAIIHHDSVRERLDASWTEEKRIAHAFGGLGKKVYTESAEAFMHNYDRGFRVFEVDLEYTSDGILVGAHSWNNNYLKKTFGYLRPDDDDGEWLTRVEFHELQQTTKYSPLTFNQMRQLLTTYSDAILIIDGKYNDEETVHREYADILRTCQEYPGVADRLIPTIYNQKMYSWVSDIYKWHSMIYMWYQLEPASFSPTNELKFAFSHGIPAVAYGDKRENELINNEARKYGIKTYVHTIDDEDIAMRLENDNVYGLITNSLAPEY